MSTNESIHKNPSFIDWNNRDISSYYENVPVKKIREYAQKGGLEKGKDIDLIYPFLENCESLIEVGAGYGRVIECLIKKGFPGEITAIERSQNFFNHLYQKYDSRVNLILGDILKEKIDKKFHAVLFMWSNISEFSKKEKITILKKLASLTRQDGILILETIDSEQVPKNVDTYHSRMYSATSEYGKVYGYNLSNEEIDKYIKKIGMQLTTRIKYITPTFRKRVLHLLTFERNLNTSLQKRAVSWKHSLYTFEDRV